MTQDVEQRQVPLLDDAIAVGDAREWKLLFRGLELDLLEIRDN